ncbi:unnamed protein product, partial [Didymodactylos carnosus]
MRGVDCHGVLHEKRQRNLPLELLIIDRLKFNCTTDGLYPDPNKDCYIYHSCLNGIHEIEYCQYPLIFNPEKSKFIIKTHGNDTNNQIWLANEKASMMRVMMILGMFVLAAIGLILYA